MKEWCKRLDAASASHCYPVQHGWSPPVEDIPPLTSWVISMDCTSQIAPAWILSTGLSPLGIDCSDDPHRAAGFWSIGTLLWLQLASGHIHLLQHGVLHLLQVKICSTLALRGLQGHSCLTKAVATSCRGMYASAAGTTSPFSSSLTSGSSKKLPSHFLSPLSQLLFCNTFYPFLNVLWQRQYQHHWWAQLWPATGLCWSCLGSALPGIGTTSGVLSQKAVLQTPHYKDLAM